MQMDKAYEEFLDKYIPSADVRARLIETDHQFSDWDRAAIIWNSDIPLQDKHAEIQIIADETSDAKLRRQIVERIDYDKDALRLFKENSDGFIYALNSHEFTPKDDIVGYFESYDMALKEGKKLGFDFSIEKHQVVNEGTVRIKGQSITSTILEPDESKQIEEEDYYCAVSEGKYDKNGQILSYWSSEMPKERMIKVETLSNKRFENKFVVFPKVFETNDKVRCVGRDLDDEKFIGWVNRGFWDYDEFIKKATAENAIEDYSDAALSVDYWAEDCLTWDHSHILPIYLEKVREELCNSFDEDHQVIIGHDFGGAVWLQAVEMSISEKILPENIKEVGKEISIDIGFFDRVLKSVFIETFDADMVENKNRYTYAFSEEGRYLNCFEENILEYNFFTYEQMEMILDIIEDCVRDGAQRIEKRIGCKDAIQMVTFAAHTRRIMAENPSLRLVSVLS